MNLEEMESRVVEIEKAMQQAVANYNALDGGRQELLYWIQKLKDSEKVSVVLD
jgi:hypothetical protein